MEERKERDIIEGARWKKAATAVTMFNAKVAIALIFKHFYFRSNPGNCSVCKQVGGIGVTFAGIRWCMLEMKNVSGTLKPNEIRMAWWKKRC